MRQALDPGWLVLNIANLTLKIVQTIKTCGVECRKMKPLFRAEIMEKADTMELKSLERDAALLVLEKMKCRECDTEDLCNGEGVEEGLEDNAGSSVVSLVAAGLKLFSDILRPISLEADDLGLNGSTASAKYSWLRACVDVGRFRGSHIKHQVTKLLNDCGQ